MDRADAVFHVTRGETGRRFESPSWMLAPYRGCVKRHEHGAAERRDPVVGRAHRPVLLADITALIDAAGGTNSSSHEEVAHATATGRRVGRRRAAVGFGANRSLRSPMSWAWTR